MTCIDVFGGREGDTRQYVVQATVCRWRPFQGSSLFAPRFARCLADGQRSVGGAGRSWSRTSDVLVEDVIFLDDIVKDSLDGFVYY